MEIVLSVCFGVLIAATALVYRALCSPPEKRRRR